MMLMYAVVPVGAAVPDLTGVSGGGLESVGGPEVAVVVEECERLPNVDQVVALRFADILTELNRSSPVLPVRFPTGMADRADVRAELRRRGPDWYRRLGELDGLVEMVVRATGPDDTAATVDEEESGGAYLRRRAAAVRAYETLDAELRGTVDPWCRKVRRLSSAQGVRLACLVPRSAAPKLRQALDEWRERVSDHEVRISGPWPPFSFVDEPEYPHHD